MSAMTPAMAAVPSRRSQPPSSYPSDVQLVDVEDGETVAELGVAECGQPGRRPRRRVARAMLAECRRDDHDAIATSAELGHQPADV